MWDSPVDSVPCGQVETTGRSISGVPHASCFERPWQLLHRLPPAPPRWGQWPEVLSPAGGGLSPDCDSLQGGSPGKGHLLCRLRVSLRSWVCPGALRACPGAVTQPQGCLRVEVWLEGAGWEPAWGGSEGRCSPGADSSRESPQRERSP